MAIVTLRTIIGLRYISGIPTLDQIVIGLQFAKTTKFVKERPQLSDSIDMALVAINTYITVRKVIDKIKALKPILNQLTKIGATITNPAIIQEIISDVAEAAAAAALKKAMEIPTSIANAILDYEIEI